ncbi:Abi-domain-containing protein [Piromyces finnis]|uniref:Abi-domain-containing protein n=1 Tax=Piromyces finnis TaxID=1754191 RepID=A0A1Y1VM73_9FUNG|nr:Abi-domain-containing protein [Piromyces finnis]|eukprot:ORX60023.1 Abi-domain-containing protein [Piromyces finnis]
MESTNQKEIEQQLKENTIGIIISTCIIAPFIEEFIFRSVIFKIINWAGKKVQKNKKFIGIVIRILAFLISSFLFAFGHYNFDFKVLASEILSFSSYFFMGIALALAYDHDGYILASIFTHMLNNIIAVLIILYIDDDITNGSIIIKNFLNSF